MLASNNTNHFVGVIMTELFRHVGEKIPKPFLLLAWPVMRFVMKQPFHGAQTTLYCTLEDSIIGKSGKYYSDCHEAPTKIQAAEDMNAASKLWQLSEKLVGLSK